MTAGGRAPVHLPALPPGLPGPAYDRSRVRAGIVHLGVGGFHRAHQAVYLDDLLAAGGDPGWGVCGVGVLPSDVAMRDALRAQDHLYTVVVTHPDGRLEPRVVGALVDYLLLPDDPQAVVERMADPSVRIVSLTVTEGGYHVHPVTGELDASDPGLRADLAPGAAPRTTFGLLLAALRLRRDRGVAPFTVLSCDNLPGNGHVARRMLTAYARLADPDLGAWVAEEVAFPSCMVDRITPVTTDADRARLEREVGVVDRWPVVCEPFRQWVVEDHFPLGRPDWERVGVQATGSVEPYERVKLRLLNAGHQAIGYLGHLAGLTYVHEAMQQPELVRLLQGYLDEAVTTVHDVPGLDLADYRGAVLERFAGPQVRDTLARLCAFSSDRVPQFVLPVVRDRLAAGASVDHAALVVAAWARYAEGVDEQGRPIEVVDRLHDRVTAAAARHDADELAFLRDRDLFGDLVDDGRFTTPYVRSLRTLRTRGAVAAVREVVGG